MGTTDEAFGLFTDKVGADSKKLTFYTVLAWFIFAALAVGSIFLAAHDMHEYIWGALGFYMVFVALPLMFSPVLWLMFGTILYVIGQFGGKTGPSFDDGVTEIKKWSVPVLNNGGYFLLMAMTIWFVAMGFLNTKGYEQLCLVFLVLTPIAVYMSKRAWPTGTLVEGIIRTVILLIMIGIAVAVVVNTFDRATTEPAVQVKQALLEKQAKAVTKEREKATREIVLKIERGVDLTAQEWAHWHTLGKDSTTIAKAKAIAIKLQKKTPLTDEEATYWAGLPNIQAPGNPVIEKVAEGGVKELVKHWPFLLGIIAAIILATYLMRKPRAAGTAGTASASTAQRTFLDKVGVVVLILTLVYLAGYAIAVANDWNYYETGHIPVHNRVNSEVCVNKQFPAGVQLEFVLPGKERGELNVHVQDADGSNRHRTDLASSLFIQGVERGQPFLAPANSSCATVEWRLNSGKELPIDPPTHLNVVIRAKLPHWLEGIANKFR